MTPGTGPAPTGPGRWAARRLPSPLAGPDPGPGRGTPREPGTSPYGAVTGAARGVRNRKGPPGASGPGTGQHDRKASRTLRRASPDSDTGT